MYEYEIIHKKDDRELFIYGYTFEDACARAGYNPEDCYCVYREYID